MDVNPIRSEADYLAALSEIEQLMDSNPEQGTPSGDKLDVLSTLVEAYESKNYPIEAADPIEALKFRMEQVGLVVADLVPYIGNANRVYEVLNGKRPLTLRMIRNLNRELGIPAQSLIAESSAVA
jgi:HTH-type transcriptional regulator/antitoxin HigA